MLSVPSEPSLTSVPATVVKKNILGVSDSYMCRLEDGTLVAYFGSDVTRITRSG